MHNIRNIHHLQPIGLKIHRLLYNEMVDWNFSGLLSPFWRCYVPITDGGFVTYKEKIALSPGSFYLIPPYTPFSTGHSRPFYKAHAHFSYEASNVAVTKDVYRFAFTKGHFRRVRALLQNTPDSPAKKHALYTMILAVVIQGLQQIPVKSLLPAVADHRIQKSIDMMKRTMQDPVTLSALAAEFAIAQRSFSRLFKKTTGTSWQAYYVQMRLEHACELLLRPEHSIDEVARLCGFCDRNHFTRSFTDVYERAPGKFRKGQ